MDPPVVSRNKRRHGHPHALGKKTKKQRTLLDYFPPVASESSEDANGNHVLVGSSSLSLQTEVLFQNVLKCLTVADITTFGQTSRASQRLVQQYRGPLPHIIREELQPYKLQYVNLVDPTATPTHDDDDDGWISEINVTGNNQDNAEQEQNENEQQENDRHGSPRRQAHRRFFQPQSNQMRRQAQQQQQQRHQERHHYHQQQRSEEEDDEESCASDCDSEHPLDYMEVSRCRTVRFLLKTQRHRVVEVHLKFGTLLWTEMVDVILGPERTHKTWVEVKVYRQVKEGTQYRRIQLFENVVTYHDDLGSIQYYLEGMESSHEQELAAAIKQVLLMEATARASSATEAVAMPAPGRTNNPSLVTHGTGSRDSHNSVEVNNAQHPAATWLVRSVDQLDFGSDTTTSLPLPPSLATESNQRDVVHYVYTCAQRIAQKSPSHYNFPNLQYTIHQALAPPLRQCYLPSHHYGSAVHDENSNANHTVVDAAALAVQGPPRAEALWLYRKPPCLVAKRNFFLDSKTPRDQHGQLTFEFPIDQVPWYQDWYPALQIHPRHALQSLPPSIVHDSILPFLDGQGQGRHVVDFLKKHWRRGD